KIFGLGKSKKEEELDEACRKAKEATDSLKEGAHHIKETSEHIKNTADSTSETEPIKGAVTNAWNNTSTKIEDKVAEKIRDRVMGQEDQKDDDEKSN
ncbi:Microtubule-associated protein mu-2, partial [Bienertia sinuspersici]